MVGESIDYGLTPQDLGIASPQSPESELLPEKAVAIGRNFLAKQLNRLKSFLTGPLPPEAQMLAYSRMLKIYSTHDDPVLSAKLKLMQMRYESRPRENKNERKMRLDQQSILSVEEDQSEQSYQ